MNSQMKTAILAVSVDRHSAGVISDLVKGRGHEFFETDNFADETGGTPLPYIPDLVMLEAASKPYDKVQSLINEAARRFPGSRTAVLVKEKEIKNAMLRFKQSTDEFIPVPVDETHLETVLNRTVKDAELKARLRQLENNGRGFSESDISHRLETERFIIVKQLVDKMSSFIGEIARDVEDGIRYFHSTPYFVSIHSRDLKIVANDAIYQRYFGNMAGANSWDIYHGKAASPEQCPVGRTMQTGMVQRTKAVVRYAGGKKAPVIVHTAPIYNNNGDIELVLEVSAGSKEIRRLRKELRTTQQKYQKLFDEVPDYIAVLDRKFRITAVNRRFQEKFGDCTGEHFFDIFSKETFSETDCPLVQTLHDGRAHHVETDLIAPDNKKFNVMLSTAPVNDIGSNIFQIIVIFKDVTQLKSLEDRLSTLGLMFSVISHNIKGVLTGLDAGLYLIDHGFYKNVPGRIEEGLEVSTMMAERIRKMVLDVLYYAKPRELQLENTNIAELSEDVCRHIRPKMGARDIEFICDVDSGAGEFEVDREIFRSILVNLLENAMEACMDPRLERAMQVRFSAGRNRDGARFEIADNGTGMDTEQKNKIFSKFYSSKGNKGTGLGLFIARKVVEQHGGKIYVDSEPGTGSRFRVIMPLNVRASG